MFDLPPQLKKNLKYITMPNNMMEVIFEVIVFAGFKIVISWFLQILNEKKKEVRNYMKK